MEAVFRGESGRLYRFAALRPGEAAPAAPAVYAFARAEGLSWRVLFLSRTANLCARLARHERWAEAELLGATHVLLHAPEARDAREAVEADLLGRLRPVLNGPSDAGAAVHVLRPAA